MDIGMIRAVHDYPTSEIEVDPTEEIENPIENTSSKVDLLDIEINLEYMKQKVKIGAHLLLEEREDLFLSSKKMYQILLGRPLIC